MMGNMMRIFVITAQIAVAATVILTAGCHGAQFLEGNRPYPKRPVFTLIPRDYSGEELEKNGILTNGVYVDIGYRPLDANHPGRIGTAYYRFWPNGRVLFRMPPYHLNTYTDRANVVDSFENGKIGYYVIDEDGTLWIEIYDYHPGMWRYKHFKARWIVEGDTIWKAPSPVRTGADKYYGEPVQIGFQFFKVDDMEAQPDW